jgi:signal transduction histidine kinase
MAPRDERGQPFAEDQSPYARILRGEAIGVEHTVEAIVRTSAGRDIQVGMSGTPLMSAAGAVVGGIVVTRDVTEQRRREGGLSDANRGMREFLAVAAHDLRTPITASKGYIQLAVRRLNHLAALATTEAPSVVGSIAQVRKNLEDAEQNSQRLARLVDRLLDAAQIQANKLEMHTETVDLAAIVYTKVREQRLATPARAIRYKVRPMRAVPALIDPERIGEVLQNYLANALKYSPEDSVVEVTFGVRDGVARISVRDTGLGIPAADQQRIWSRFEQLEGAQHRRSAVGLGLGLYISRAIVEAHGGLVGLESEVGCGSTFWFEVPLDHHSD